MCRLPQAPDLNVQRSAMKKLDFLVGDWSGEMRIQRGPGEPIELIQTELAQYKLDGLVLTIEGTGKAKSTGQVHLQALGIISYDDDGKSYRLRVFNDGRFLEAELMLSDKGQGMSWGFALGDIRTNSVMRINDRGEWTELHEILMGSQEPKKLMDVVVRRIG